MIRRKWYRPTADSWQAAAVLWLMGIGHLCWGLLAMNETLSIIFGIVYLVLAAGLTIWTIIREIKWRQAAKQEAETSHR